MSAQFFNRRRYPPAPRSRRAGLGPVLLVGALVVSAAILMKPAGRLQEGAAHVVDGDSLRLDGVDIRLKGIDAPELHQSCERAGQTYPCGEAARAALIGRIGRQPVRCAVSGHDRYGRDLARCSVDGEDLGAWMVRSGWAVGYGDYADEEGGARVGHAGLWAGTFERPSDWRQEHPRP